MYRYLVHNFSICVTIEAHALTCTPTRTKERNGIPTFEYDATAGPLTRSTPLQPPLSFFFIFLWAPVFHNYPGRASFLILGPSHPLVPASPQTFRSRHVDHNDTPADAKIFRGVRMQLSYSNSSFFVSVLHGCEHKKLRPRAKRQRADCFRRQEHM